MPRTPSSPNPVTLHVTVDKSNVSTVKAFIKGLRPQYTEKDLLPHLTNPIPAINDLAKKTGMPALKVRQLLKSLEISGVIARNGGRYVRIETKKQREK